MDRKYKPFGVLPKMHLFTHNFTDRKKLMILFHYKHQVQDVTFTVFFSFFCIFSFVLCFSYWQETDNAKITNVTVKAFNSLQNDVCFSHLGQNCGRSIFSGQSAIFQVRAKTHCNMRILTMCETYP